MRKKKLEKPVKTCADCIHEYACQMWNLGHIHEMDATNCPNDGAVYATARDAQVAYLIMSLEEKV